MFAFWENIYLMFCWCESLIISRGSSRLHQRWQRGALKKKGMHNPHRVMGWGSELLGSNCLGSKWFFCWQNVYINLFRYRSYCLIHIRHCSKCYKSKSKTYKLQVQELKINLARSIERKFRPIKLRFCKF